MAEETFIDFYVEGKHRTFKIVVEEKTFYVNGHFLGEISSFFDAAFFGGFAEAREKLVTLVDENACDVISFLRIVHPNGYEKITAENCATMMRYSRIWDVPLLRSQCMNWLLNGFSKHLHWFNTTLTLLKAALLHGFERATENLVSRLASFGQTFLINWEIPDKITDSATLTALFVAAPEVIVEQSHSPVNCFSPLRSCMVYDCARPSPAALCSDCSLTLCRRHLKDFSCGPDSQFRKVNTQLLYGLNVKK